MPYKNQVKTFYEDSYYHVYARGINKMQIFKDSLDYNFFLYLLKKYLTKDFTEKRIINGNETLVKVNSMYGLVYLHAFCLIPNHFHLLLKNVNSKGISCLMRRVLSVYSIYFNKRYNRQGSLYQGNYRSIYISNEHYFITCSLYIHLNSLKHNLSYKISDYPYSSYKFYKNGKSLPWLTLEPLLLKDINYADIESYLPRTETWDLVMKD